mmetsp:Transcript_86503/g.171737  ORF Transcript_86503/g.171737 Transcript_86503/m.171737 type:complete len:256 (+) Transcript_86503:854-1621(+)
MASIAACKDLSAVAATNQLSRFISWASVSAIRKLYCLLRAFKSNKNVRIAIFGSTSSSRLQPSSERFLVSLTTDRLNISKAVMALSVSAALNPINFIWSLPPQSKQRAGNTASSLDKLEDRWLTRAIAASTAWRTSYSDTACDVCLTSGVEREEEGEEEEEEEHGNEDDGQRTGRIVVSQAVSGRFVSSVAVSATLRIGSSMPDRPVSRVSMVGLPGAVLTTSWRRGGKAVVCLLNTPCQLSTCTRSRMRCMIWV